MKEEIKALIQQGYLREGDQVVQKQPYQNHDERAIEVPQPVCEPAREPVHEIRTTFDGHGIPSILNRGQKAYVRDANLTKET